MRAEGGSSNLINGVSRQPAEVRLPSQLQESLNQFPSVTKGLSPRAPALYLGSSVADASNARVHFIDRDASERYVVRASSSGIAVTDLAGTPKTVATPDGVGYLTGANKEDLELLTVADHTFVLNKTKTVATKPTLSPSRDPEALVHVVSFEYHTAYIIKINGSVAAEYRMSGGPLSNDNAQLDAERVAARRSNLAQLLIDGTLHNAAITTEHFDWSAGVITKLSDTLTTGWSVTRIDGAIHIVNTDGDDFSIEVEASGSEESFKVHKGLVTDFASLPAKGPAGFTIKVSGSKDTDYDDYWVKFDQGANDGQGRWVETVAPGIECELDPATLPHILVREADGTFTFRQAEYAAREVGDLDTNPWPSFVGNPIRALGFHKSRLAFTARENIVASRVGEFYTFFRESVLTLLDTDPIDYAISYDAVSTINHVLSFDEECIIMTDSVPFRLSGGEVLSPKTVNAVPLLSNKSSPTARPVGAGNKLFFVNDMASGAVVHEFVYDRELGLKDAPAINEHAAGYIPTGTEQLEADDDLRMLVLGNGTDTLSVYKWLWIGREKAQSAWQKWTFPGPVRAFRFIDENLVVSCQIGSRLETLAVNCHEAWSDDLGVIIHLDRRVKVSGVYNATADTTTFATPYNPSGAKVVLAYEVDFGLQPVIVSTGPSSITVQGNYALLDAYIGFPYEHYGELSEIVPRSRQSDGTEGPPIPNVTATIASVSFGSDASAYLNVDVTRAYRGTYRKTFSAARTGTKTGTLGKLVTGTLKARTSVMAKAEDVTIRFGNTGPYPYSVLSYHWTGSATPKGY
jgi:hypothetical protein